MKTRTKTIIIIVVLLLITGFVYQRYYFVFGEGVKAGSMNYFVKKGYMFKTYEGRLIQSGIRAPAQGGNISSNEFMFSVTDERVAKQLSGSAGSYLELHYKEYLHTLPWRGISVFVVDSVISIKPITQ
ncbi:hypothetical protein [Mucilaginibacter pocheonensis]|uniref:6-phosphogluconate dehydrogenase n=1 Tax=Mucilaginibacter pocheonensis TaxID=398050 RepID=A0ABU1TEK2_9SPHI|nr:hypothetical protein [Mucilaginibacter pocheonensis]MDR6943290.1 hypothetical protein [Mucilaginibacter pocheonensis]